MSKFSQTKAYTWLKDKWQHFKHAMYPEAYVCHCCGTEIGDDDREDSLCPKCRERLPYRHEQTCPICGCYTHTLSPCKRCQIAMPPYKQALAPFDYTGAIRRMIINYKDNGSPWLAPYIAKYLITYAKAMELTADYLVYVPSSDKAIKTRGFEHNKKVATLICTALDMPLTEPLHRVYQKKDQSNLTYEERYQNVQGSFILREDYDRSLLIGKKILLIDDVMTTGATVTTCAQILKNNGAQEIIILTLARS
ncbi:MAG: ComF family protein [Clostridia bacterium]|nr:ComF family protein [Clostridia bacterium]